MQQQQQQQLLQQLQQQHSSVSEHDVQSTLADNQTDNVAGDTAETSQWTLTSTKSHQRASDSLKNSTHYMYLYTLSVCLDDTHHWYTASNCCDVSWEIWQTQRRHDIHITHCSYHSPHFISSEISLLWLAAATPNWVVCCESTQFATNHSTQLKWRKVATSGDEVQ